MSGWSLSTGRLAYGGDYNPEQWPESVWLEDVRLMCQAGVNLVTVGVFSWATLQSAPGTFDFGWLDRVLDLLHEYEIRVDLATGTASPPPWFSRLHPESLPVTRDGTTLWPGARQAYCPSSTAYREAACALVEQLATRYGSHPALELWHVNNEYGCHVAECYCDASAAAFRCWLRDRYSDLDALNAAWGTAFWSQRYHDWEEILPPRVAPTHPNPAQQLDFARFSSDELLACYRAEVAVLRRLTPQIPITTNFMTPSFKPLDYFAWAPELDVVSTDHYLLPHETETNQDVALSADLTRGLAGQAPWLLMEHSTSAVNWQRVNLAKAPGELRRNSLSHIARGSNGALFFQWRQSRSGAEKYHSALVPHPGTDTRVWREVVALGEELASLSDVVDAPVDADVALVWDYESWWALELDSRPSEDVGFLDRVRAFHFALWQAGITADIIAPGDDLSHYKLVLVPSLYLVREPRFLDTYVEWGGHVVISYFSGIVDEHDGFLPGPYPGAFRDLLGLQVEEFQPLAPEDVRRVGEATATVWREHLRLEGAEAILQFDDGAPAVTRHAFGDGVAWYVGTRLDDAGTTRLLSRIWHEAGVEALLPELPLGVERVRRGEHVFVLNHTAEAIDVPGHGQVAAGDAVVLRIPR